MEKLLNLVYILAIVGLCSGASIRTRENIDLQLCRSQYLRMVQEGSSSSKIFPRCDENGLYKPLQITLSNFECYFPNGGPDDIYKYPGEGPCHMLRQCLKNHTSEGDEDYKFIQCDKFGLFKALQRQQNGNIICAWPDGEFPEPYGVTPGKRECLEKQPCAHTKKERLETSLIGTLPRCDDEGRFKPLQRFNNRLECYFPNGADFINEYAAQGPCRKVRECLKQKYHTTQGVKDHKLLRCDKHGYFKPMQRQDDGEKICVDPRGNVRKSSGVKGKKDCLYSVIVH